MERLDLFHGPHIAACRFERALEDLDLVRAREDAPAEWREAMAELEETIRNRRSGRGHLAALISARRQGWPAPMERCWQRLVGRALDGQGIPGVLDGEPAAAFLLRGGEEERARASLVRHLARYPVDARAWVEQARFEPLRAAVRAAFHGGILLPEVGPVLEVVEEDDHDPPETWVLPYAWLCGALLLDEVEEALRAAGHDLQQAALPLMGDGTAFALCLCAAEAGRRRRGSHDARTLDARRLMRSASKRAFMRYLRRVG